MGPEGVLRVALRNKPQIIEKREIATLLANMLVRERVKFCAEAAGMTSRAVTNTTPTNLMARAIKLASSSIKRSSYFLTLIPSACARLGSKVIAIKCFPEKMIMIRAMMETTIVR